MFVEAGVQAGHAHNPDFNGATQEGVGCTRSRHRNGERFSAAKGYLAAPGASQPAGHHRGACHARPAGNRRAVGVEYRQGGAS